MRVAVLGAGYAGLVLARRLERTLPPEADIVVVDERPDHLVQHELHRVVRRPSFAADITVPLADLLDRAELRTERVTGLDRKNRTVSLSSGTMGYDVAAVCLGAQTAYYDLPGVEEHSLPLKRVPDALAIRQAALDTLDAGGGTIVVGGAGLSGVQVAGELAEMTREEGANGRLRTVLLEQREVVAPSFPVDFSEAVRRELVDRGVEVHTGATVERATDGTVHVAGGDRVAYDALVWTGGIRGPDAFETDRPTVRSTLALDERTFVVGDAGRVVDADGEPVPASAQAAVAQAETAATNIERTVEYALGGDGFRPRLEQFRFEPVGWLVSVGDGAVAKVGPTTFTGPAARTLKSSVGVTYLASAGALRKAVGLAREEFDP